MLLFNQSLLKTKRRRENEKEKLLVQELRNLMGLYIHEMQHLIVHLK